MTGGMSATTSKPRQHDTSLILEARQLAEGGWTAYRIAKILSRRGTPVAQSTVQYWLDPRLSDRKRAQMRRQAAHRRAARAKRRTDHTPEFKLARLHALHAAGVPAEHIATVLALDFGDAISPDTVRRVVKDGRIPRCWRDRRGTA